MNVNITNIKLLNVPLENDYKNTLYFADKSSQLSYFNSKVVKNILNCTYQRKDNVIRVPEHIDNLWNCNYVMYKNSAYGDKWFYSFIKNMEYVNDGLTLVYIETDVMQTWMFDYQVKSSFVEREHVDDDTTGKHTVPEALETGEYITNSHTKDTNLNEMNIILAYSDYAENGTVHGDKYGGIYSGLGYYAYPNNTVGIGALNTKLVEYDVAGKSDGVNSIFMAPQFISGGALIGGSSIISTDNPQSYDLTIPKLNSLNGYTPKNKKLLCYPYCYLIASNNNGAANVYQQELFSGSSNTFKVNGVLSPGCSIRMVPTNYKGSSVNDEEGLNLGKYSICSWNSDTYTNWLTQNSVNVGLSTVGAAGSLIAGGIALTGTGAGAIAGIPMIASGIMGIASTMGSVYTHSLTPGVAKGNVNGGDVITASNNNTFHFYNMSIKQEYAKLIDKYFDMFGYKVNMVKIPNKNHRSKWWYTKTIDVNIDGAIPNDDINKIKNCYNTGITFWKNASEIQDYSLTNDIV